LAASFPWSPPRPSGWGTRRDHLVTLPAPRTKVLFIGGEGRSGSTVLERLIANEPGTCAIGEGKYLFERGIGSGELCGCGSPVPECELWSTVGQRLVGGWDSPEGRDLVAFFARFNSPRNLPAAVLGRGRGVRRAQKVLAELYPIIAEVSGSPLVIDSSKHPAWAYLLAGTDTVDVRVVHLVRHPSGVVQSWSRAVERPQAEVGAGDRLMPAHRPAEVAVRWAIFNRLFHRLARRSIPTVLVRYEDYVEDLEGTMRACLGLFGLPYGTAPAGMGNGHGIAGNPSRFADGDQAIRVDNRWITEMGAIRHFMVSTLTWRTRSAYGYRWRRDRAVAPIVRHAHGQIAVGGSDPVAGDRVGVQDTPLVGAVAVVDADQS
jgi:hypothetical protein